MVRGVITFKCTNCKNKFKGLDVELYASTLSVPQQCPNCGSRRTMPNNLLFSSDIKFYRKVWEEYESHNKENKVENMDIPKLLDGYTDQQVTEEDLEQAKKKSVNLKDKMKDFLLLIDIFQDAIAGEYKVSTSTLVTLGGAILYVVSPLDFIPDFLPIIGWTDDIAVIGFVLNKLSSEIEKYKEFRLKNPKIKELFEGMKTLQ